MGVYLTRETVKNFGTIQALHGTGVDIFYGVVTNGSRDDGAALDRGHEGCPGP